MIKETQRLLSKIFKSKFTVILAIFFVWIAGSQAQTSADYHASTAYQYYLLGSKASDLQEDAEEKEAPVKLGSLGSGGVSGEFSYDDIVNSADVDDKKQAEQFASIMATYSTFNYFSNKVEGFGSIMIYVGRFLSLVILLPLAVLMDLLHLIIPTLVGLIAELNIIRLLADVLTNLQITTDLANMLGISKKAIANFTTILFSFAVVMILLSLGGMFRTGGRIDQRSYSKLKGRLFSIIALPLIVGIGAYFIDELVQFTAESEKASGNFSRYLVDNRSWAYNFNFAPNGKDGKDGNISPTASNSYVDLKYNPYTGYGADRIRSINSKSSLAKNGGKGNIFPNSSLVLAYGSSESFSAVDFINYKGTEASKSYYGRDDGNGKSFGSYYDYAQNNKKKLIDVDQSYLPSGKKKDGDKQSQKGGYKEAIDDYKSGDELIVSPQIAWRDRFIYGAKNSGENIDKYYNEPPSVEQMENQVGRSNGEAFSNQTMFLILSTMFNETGGKYYIDAPSRGIMQAKAAFDSNRSDYYVVSMVGNPFFTIFGLISKPIIQLVIMLAVITAVLSLGIIEMNTKPLMAWIKGMTLGDMEYAQALIVYCLGIGGTVLSLIVIPPMLGSMMEAIGKLIVLPAYFLDRDALSPQASIALHGTPLIFSSLLSIFFAFLFFKSPSFRHKLIELFTMSWAWAKSTGERIEIQASGGTGLRTKQENTRLASRGRFNQAMSQNRGQHQGKPQSRFGAMKSWMKDAKDGVKRDLNIPTYDFSNKGADASDSAVISNDRENVYDAKTIERNGIYERAMNGLKENEIDRDLPNTVQMATIEAQEGIMKFHKEPTRESFTGARTKMDLLGKEMSGDGYSDKQKSRLANVKREFFSLAKSHNIMGDDGEANHDEGSKQQGLADQLFDNDMIQGITGISGSTLKNIEGKYNEISKDPIGKKLREKVGTDWENQGYGSGDNNAGNAGNTSNTSNTGNTGNKDSKNEKLAFDDLENDLIKKGTGLDGAKIKEGLARTSEETKNPLLKSYLKHYKLDMDKRGYGSKDDES